MPGYDFTEHARDVILEREIAITWVVQYEGRVLRVVYNAAVDPPQIVTAYFDRRQRGKT